MLQQQNALDKIEDRFADGGVPQLGLANGDIHLPPVLGVHVGVIAGNVGAINRKRRQHFSQCIAQAFQRKIARPAMLLGNVIQPAGEHVQLAGHGHLQDEPLAVAHQIVERSGPAGEAAIELLEGPLFRVIHEEPIHQVQKTIARGAFHRPFHAQRFVAAQDLFGHDIERPIRVVLFRVPIRSRGPSFAGVLQEPEIFLRFKQTIRVIHAQSANMALPHQIENQLMHRRKYFGIFHANSRQIVDVEEAPVVDLIHRNAPEAEAIGFALQQPLETIETARLPAPAVDFD